VILFHQHFAPFGRIGVDLFFVLSGYLITGILRQSRTRTDFWQAFYLKRATRILPPVVPLIAVAFLLTKHAAVSSALLYLFFMGGLDVVHRNTIPIILALWSLAVEEHFYLLWPFAIRFLSLRSLKIILISTVALEPLLRFAALHFLSHADEKIYYLTPFRLDGLALGSMLALLLESSRLKSLISRYSPAVAAAAFALYAALWIFDPGDFNPSATSVLYCCFSYSIISCGMAGLIAYVVISPEGLLSRVLALRPMVWLGSISYGLYLFSGIIGAITGRLFHTPSYPPPDPLLHKLLLFEAPLLILASWLSFRFYEHPIVLWGKQTADNNLRTETYKKESALP
jgi:peptidoglycan/LPS O-acetylase OafA/YrhL